MIDDLLPPLPALVGGLQAFAGLAWLITATHFFGAVRRLWGRRARADDYAGLWVFVMGLAQTGFTLLWLILGRDDVAVMDPGQLRIWACLYLVSGVAAQGLLYSWPTVMEAAKVAALAGHRVTSPARGRAWIGAALWALMAAAAVGVLWLRAV